MKKSFIIFPLLITFIQFFQIFYFERNYFTEKYDVSYWKDRYEHSQYVLPLSKRIIGDDGLFAYAGYRLIKGDNPFSINVDKPPLGKYLIGLSILVFKNPAYYALFFGIGSLLIFYKLAQYLLKEKLLALGITAVLFLDPLFFTQFWKPWIDIAQLFFLFLNIFLILKILKISDSKKNILLPAAIGGFSLGLFSEIKPPLLLPIVLVLETIFFIQKKIKRTYLFFILGFLVGIFLPYIQYQGQTFWLLDVLKVHKFMASIYLQSQLKVHTFSLWQTLFFGKFPDISSGLPTIVLEWSVFWPIITVFGIIASFLFLVKKNISIEWKGISLFLLLSLIIYTLIPSYPRYLIIILPFLYLFIMNLVGKINSGKLKVVLISVVLAYGVIHSSVFLTPKPENILNNFYYNFSHQYFQDIYQEDLARGFLPKIDREKFRVLTQKAMADATIKAIGIKEENISINNDRGVVKLFVTYKTQNLGPFLEEKTIYLVKENQQWKIRWDWNILIDGFKSGYTIETKTVQGRRGKIIDAAGRVLAQDELGYLVLVNPEKIDTKKEREMLKFMESYGYKKDVNLQNAYLENVPPKDNVPLITFSRPISQKDKEKFLSYPGVSLVEYPSRIYNGLDWKSTKDTFFEECCTRIYSNYNYHGIKGPEKDYDSTLWGYDGGTIIVKDQKGATVRNILIKTKKDGNDVVLPL